MLAPDQAAPGVSPVVNETANVTQPAPGLALGGCKELHGLFTVPIVLIGGNYPDGLEPMPDSTGQAETAYFYASTCATGNVTGGGAEAPLTDAASAFLLHSTKTPAGHESDSIDLEFWMEVAFPGTPEMAQFLRGAGLPANRSAESRFTFTSEFQQPQGRVETATFVEGQLTHTLRLPLQASAGHVETLTSRAWVHNGTALVGYFLVEHGNWADLGSGGAYCSVVSVGGVGGYCPPLYPGMGHAVHDATQRWTFVNVTADEAS